MSVEFNSCVKNGGKVITKVPEPGKYLHICFINGKSYAGEVKTKVKKRIWKKK